ncbi:hypothetical protein RIR_jg16574.t1 [Rhizophagus irregularis DAOM 181602=DAOM 197198]|nr:hypothetical protein RIR_jg16574.t1 [Rhizophagus irregularis DAOM 181602=DAOM 197198]
MMAWEFGGSFWFLERVFFGCDILSTSKFPRHEFSVCSSGLNMLDLMVRPLAIRLLDARSDLWTRRILTTWSLYVVMICGLWCSKV